MDNDFNKRILAECSDVLVSLNTKMGLFIQSGDCQGFQVLTRAVNQIVDARQLEMTRRLNADAE